MKFPFPSPSEYPGRGDHGILVAKKEKALPSFVRGSTLVQGKASDLVEENLGPWNHPET
jgi:hypothetical protein